MFSRRSNRVRAYIDQQPAMTPIPVAAPPQPPAPVISTRRSLQEAYVHYERTNPSFQRLLQSMPPGEVDGFRQRYFMTFVSGYRLRAQVRPE